MDTILEIKHLSKAFGKNQGFDVRFFLNVFGNAGNLRQCALHVCLAGGGSVNGGLEDFQGFVAGLLTAQVSRGEVIVCLAVVFPCFLVLHIVVTVAHVGGGVVKPTVVDVYRHTEQ